MLSGISPRGSSSAPGNGNTGRISGRSAGPRYSMLIGIWSPLCASSTTLNAPPAVMDQSSSGKQDDRQALASLDGCIVRAAPGFEELHQLLAGAVVVPFAVALDDRQQLLGGRCPVALGVERDREVESGLMIERVCGDFLFQLDNGPELLGLLGEIDCGLHGFHSGVVALGFGYHGERLLGL